MDRLEQLRVFVRVAELSGFGRAAEDLGLPRATVSAAVAQLEASLGARLLMRTTRRVGLTPDGESLLERSRVLLADYEAITDSFPAQGSAPRTPMRGRLRVDLPGRIARQIMLPALPTLLGQYPGLEIDLGASDRIVDLVESGIDCAVRVGQLSPSSLVAKSLGEFQLVNCASPAYLAAHGIPRTLADLEAQQHWVVGYGSRPSGAAAMTATWDHVDAQGVARQTTVRSQMTVYDVETYISAACAGLGLVQLPWFDVRALVAQGALATVLPDARPTPMPVHVVVPHRRHMSPRVRLFANWMQELLADGLQADPAAATPARPASAR